MIYLISAIGLNREIGKDNKLLWRQKHDLMRFKELTINNIVIMGLNTFKSLGSKPLKDRLNIVLSDEEIDDSEYDNLIVYSDFDKLLQFCKVNTNKEIWVIGGQTIYNLFINYANKLYITQIQAKFPDADTFFPEIDEKTWYRRVLSKKRADENNDFDCTYDVYLKQ